jgi:hypothetical protein
VASSQTFDWTSCPRRAPEIQQGIASCPNESRPSWIAGSRERRRPVLTRHSQRFHCLRPGQSRVQGREHRVVVIMFSVNWTLESCKRRMPDHPFPHRPGSSPTHPVSSPLPVARCARVGLGRAERRRGYRPVGTRQSGGDGESVLLVPCVVLAVKTRGSAAPDRPRRWPIARLSRPSSGQK